MAFHPQDALDRLVQAYESDRLAHAYLFLGQRGSGKGHLVETISARILKIDIAKVSAHPDFHAIEPESKSRRILIEPVRNLERAIRSSSTLGGRRIALIRDADRLQPQAANAFLKTLEEPPSDSHVFLTSSLPGALLDTIVSRCIVVHLRSPGIPPLGPAEEKLVAVLETQVTSNAGPTMCAFSLARKFLEVLAAEREAIQEEHLEALKLEKAHYKDATDGSWLEEREEQVKALSEAAAIRCRTDLLQAISNWFADQLRVKHGTTPLFERTFPSASTEDLQTKSLLRAVHALDQLTADLALTVQEPVAIEAGFLKVFRALQTS